MLSLAHVCEFPTFSNYKISIRFLFFQNIVQPKGLQLQNYKFIMTYRVSSADYFGMTHFFLLNSIKSNTLESLVWFGLYICPYKPKPIYR